MQTLPLTDQELAAWLRLSMAPGLNPAALRGLLTAFGLPEAVFSQSFTALAEAAGEAAARAALAPPPSDFPAQLDAVRAWRDLPGNALLTLDDPAYPPLLLTMPDPPPLLYVKGRIELLHARSIAVVGSRSATPQGIEDSARFARAFSDAGVTVVSGLASGVDGAAHRGALQGRGGTVAVIGTGADIVYPSSHHALAHQIATHGAILSEWPLGTPARSANFPQRNRLIAGLVNGVLVVEAAMRSGSLITARFANEMGRDVFAIPGSIHAPLALGCHRMIKQGAKLAETPEDVLDELGFAGVPSAAQAAARRRADAKPVAETAREPEHVQPEGGSVDAALLLDALGHAPTTLEILAERTDMNDTLLQSTLLRLELAGDLCALPGGRYVRTTRSG